MAIRFIDLFCGVGGFRYAMENAAAGLGRAAKCVFSSDIDPACRAVYERNFGERPAGDITAIDPAAIPDHDVLLAGFPCQPFSIIGKKKGFEDTRGTLFFNIATILQAKRPRAFVLENVKQLRGHDSGRTLRRILETLLGLGYFVTCRVFNARGFGLPQNRERIFIAGFRGETGFRWPSPGRPMRPLADLLEKDVPERFYVSGRIRARRLEKGGGAAVPAPGIWHENKSGHISVHPYSCALRAGASYNYLLVDGVRRLTGREMFRLQGFPDSFILPDVYAVARRQAGNSLPVPVAQAVIENVLLGTRPLSCGRSGGRPQETTGVRRLPCGSRESAPPPFEEGALYGA